MTNTDRSYYVEPRDVLSPQEISAIHRHFKGNKEEICWTLSHNTRLLDPRLFNYELRQYLQGNEGPAYKLKMVRAQMKDLGIVVTEEDIKDPRGFFGRAGGFGKHNIKRATLDIATLNQIYKKFKTVNAAFDALYGLMNDEADQSGRVVDVGRIVFYKALNGESVQEYKVKKIQQAFERFSRKENSCETASS